MYIGIDLGTTGCKGVLYNCNGEVLAEYYKEYDLITKGKYIEQDANLWWSIVKEAIMSASYGYGKSIKALSVSTQGISFVPVDINGKPLYNGISWLDTRAEHETELLRKKFGEKAIFSKTGKQLKSVYTLPKLMWFKNNCSDIYQHSYKILMPLDYINFRLSGCAVTDHSMASGAMMYNINTRQWDDELLEFAGIDKNKLPQIGCMGEVIGTILPHIADEIGVSRNTTVILGGQDQKLAAIGAGITDKICTVSFGTATAITKVIDNLSFDENMRFPCFVLNDKQWVTEACIPTTGAALKWVANTLFGGKTYKELNELAEQSPKGANGVEFKSDLSENGQIEGLKLSTTQGDIVRALYEGICHQIKEYVDVLGGTEQIRVFGGGAKSNIWCQILADITGVEVCRLSTCETATLGAAMLASQGKIPCAKIERRMNKKC